MSKQTFIYFHSLDLLQASFIFTENGKVTHSTLRVPLAELPREAKQQDITVIMPAHFILLTEASLPKLNRQHLSQALPFALEEKLLDDIENLHFALPKIIDNTEKTPVAIVAKSTLEQWLALLNEHEIFPAEIVSAIFALPFSENNWSLSLEKETCMLRQDVYQGFSLDYQQLDLLLKKAYQEAQTKPQHLHIYDTIQAAELSAIPEVIFNHIAFSEQAWIEKIPEHLTSNAAINLLQPPYRPKRSTSQAKKIWWQAGYAALTFMTLFILNQIITFFILHHEVKQLDLTINKIYRKNFPEATSVVAPRARMEKKLALVNNPFSHNPLFILLAKTGKILKAHPQIQLKNLDFREGQLTLEIIAPRFDDIDGLIQSLTKEGLTIKQQRAAVLGTEVKANLLINRGSL